MPIVHPSRTLRGQPENRKFPAVDSWERERQLLEDARKVCGRSVTEELHAICERTRRRCLAKIKWPTNIGASKKTKKMADHAQRLREYISNRYGTFSMDAVTRTATESRWIPPPTGQTAWDVAKEAVEGPPMPAWDGLIRELDAFLEWIEPAVSKSIRRKEHLHIDVDHGASPQRALCLDCAELLLAAGGDLSKLALARLTSVAWELATGKSTRCTKIAQLVINNREAVTQGR
jgi:hypothetical protein